MREPAFKIAIHDHEDTKKHKNIILAVFFDAKKNLVLSDRQLEEANLDKKEIKKLADYHNFKGKMGELALVSSPLVKQAGEYERLYLLGLGDLTESNAKKTEEAGDKAYASLKSMGVKDPAIVLPLVEEAAPGGMKQSEFFEAFLTGLVLKSYVFDDYKSKDGNKAKKADKDEAVKLEKLCFIGADKKALKAVDIKVAAITGGVFLTRDLCNMPPNELNPESYAKEIKAVFKGTNVKVTVLGEKKLRDLKADLLLSVGQASAKESQLVIMDYRGAAKSKKPIAFVGKGVCFDTGGNNLKPFSGMLDMKMDMGGSAVVVGLMKALATRKAKVNAVGVVGLVENMVAGNATRPSDVVKAMSGKTVEILNTDAEGRLVLADALWYTQEKYKPSHVVDLATLTGAIIHCLGGEFGGLFSNSDDMASSIQHAGEQANEPAWRLPLCEGYSKAMESDVADIKNLGGSGVGAGSATAAAFLQYFIQDGVEWSHLDIAGTTMMKGGWSHVDKGATGYGVRLLDRYVLDHFEG